MTGRAVQPSARDDARWALVAACTGTFILLVNVSIVVVALPELARDLDAGPVTERWVIASYALALAALLLGAGSLADRIGHRHVFVAGLVLFLIASSVCGAAWSAGIMLAGRVAQGTAAAMLFSSSLALIAGAFPGRRRATALGVWAATVGVSTTVGPLLGGLLVDALSWRWVFLINLPTAAAAVAIVLLRVPELGERVRAPVDWAGQGLAASGLAAVVYALASAGDGGWLRPTVLAPLAVGLALLTAFVVVELRRTHPLLDPRLLRRAGLTGAAVAGFAMHSSMIPLYVFIAIWLQDVRGYSAILTGVVFVPSALMGVLLGPLAGRLAAVVSHAVRVATGLALVALGLLAMRALGPSSSWVVLVPGLLLSGAGLGIANPAIAGAALAALEPARSGLAAGLNTTCRQLGTAVGVAALGSLLQLRGGVAGADPAAYSAGLRELLLVAAGIAAVGALVASLALRGEALGVSAVDAAR